MSRHIAAVALACAVSFLSATHALSAPVTFSFAGSVTDDPFGLSSFGAPITGSYTFDSIASDTIPGSSTGSFPSVGPAFGFTANVDGTNYSVSGNLAVNTANNIGVDQYGAIAMSAALTLEVFFQDSSQTALSSDALPLLAPNLAAFDFRQFRLFSDDAEFLGTVDSLTCTAGCGTGGGGGQVPEPVMLWLIATALAGITLKKKKCR